MTAYLKIKNWEKHQHYKDRSPPWIKLYNDLLDDYEFACLRDASKMHLVGIWLLASRIGNRIPRDPEWVAKKINATDPVDLDVLVSAGFLEVCGNCSKPLADCVQNASPRAQREEAEAERETEAEREPPRAEAREESPPSGFIHPAQRMHASEVLQAWASAQPVDVPMAEREKQRGFARKIADSHSRDEVMAAFVGIGQLYPHDAKGGQPWDLRDLDRKFSKALAKARDHPQLRGRRFEEEMFARSEVS